MSELEQELTYFSPLKDLLNANNSNMRIQKRDLVQTMSETAVQPTANNSYYSTTGDPPAINTPFIPILNTQTFPYYVKCSNNFYSDKGDLEAVTEKTDKFENFYSNENLNRRLDSLEFGLVSVIKMQQELNEKLDKILNKKD